MNAIASFPAIDKLIPLLGSDRDGEVVAAAYAIGRSLKGAGYDWFDLVQAIDIGSKALTAPGRKVEPITEAEMARFALGHLDLLSPKEAEFVRSVMRLTAFGHTLSLKQANWLRAIYLAMGGRP